MKSTILLIGADPRIVKHLERVGREVDAEVRVEPSAPDVGLDDVDVIICADALFETVRRISTRASILVSGDAADSARAIEVITLGAVDYVPPNLSAPDLARHIRAALRMTSDQARPATYERPEERPDGVERIVGQSPAMRVVYKTIGRIAPRDINVLITGESGTGKELVARAILHHSPRRHAPYLAVNCAAIPETLLESELFGHEKGAFTGADQRRLGRFEQCDGGTLFLDEVGDIPLPTQAKLLRVLQDQRFQRVGGSETIQCDVRLIAATHQPLDDLMAERRFRRDLFYRLDVARIHVPPLREREVDVVLLAHYFVERYNRDFDTNIEAFAPETLRLLLQHPWPGNVRELENAIRATLVMARGAVLRPEFLPDSIRVGAGTTADAVSPRDNEGEAFDEVKNLELPAFARQRVDHGSSGAVFHDAVAVLERELIRAALRRHHGRIAPAAAHLGISRTTLRRKMVQLGIRITTT